MSRTRKSYEPGHQRKFLVVIDDTPECDRAVYYGSRRAARTNGKLTMVSVVPVGEVNQQWLGVGDLMRAEAHEEAEKRLDHFTQRARHLAGTGSSAFPIPVTIVPGDLSDAELDALA